MPRILNKDKVADTLVQRGLNGETTYYQDIFRVLPGSIVRVRGRASQKTGFGTLKTFADVSSKAITTMSRRFKTPRCRGESQLRSRRAPCATITGGLDSSSIAVIAADMLAANGNKLNTFTAVPEAGFTKGSTRKLFRRDAVRPSNSGIQCQHRPAFCSAKQRSHPRQIAKQIRLGGAPRGGILNGLWVMDILAAARSAGHDVMLGGEMGNFTMSYDGPSVVCRTLADRSMVEAICEIISSGYRWKHMMRHSDNRAICSCASFSSVHAVASGGKSTLARF